MESSHDASIVLQNLIQPLNMLRKKFKMPGCEMGKQKAGYY
jgi:hypothetical protein